MASHVDTPRVSVILPVYNGEEYLKAAIESILNQSYADFSLIVINDGSKDGSEGIVQAFKDSRILYVRQDNQGLARTLNRGIDLASSEYVARQDQDDVSVPSRFQRQVDLLNESPSIVMVGTWARILRRDALTSQCLSHPEHYSEILLELLFDNPFVHSSVMARRKVLLDVGKYTTDPNREPPEDYELWSRIARRYEVRNIPEMLQYYRDVDSGMSKDKLRPFGNKVRRISRENIAYYSGRSESDPSIGAIVDLVHGIRSLEGYVTFRQIRTTMLRAFAGLCAVAEPTAAGKLKMDLILKELRRSFLNARYGINLNRPYLIPWDLARKGRALIKKRLKT